MEGFFIEILNRSITAIIIMAIHICRQFFCTPDADEKQLLKDIARYTEPVRLGRRDERNIDVCKYTIIGIFRIIG